jgi:predicted AAA+ superfamily ATPase
MIKRDLLITVQKDLDKMPATVLFGPRQVGKTTMAKQVASTNPVEFIYLDMELPSDRIKLSDIDLFLSPLANRTVIIDEVQLIPALFPVLRALIDKDRHPGRFLLLGSASPDLLQQSAESLAGRVRYREVFPLTLNEVGGSEKLNDLWFRGGFPDAFTAENQTDAMDWQADFVRTYATRDMVMLGLPMPAVQIERLLQMLAHMHGQLINFSQLARSLGLSQPTVTNAINYLEQAMLIRTLKPWYNNIGKRLVKTPKVYIRDTGMLHYLLGLSSHQQLLGHPQAGNSWEGFVIQQILAVLPREYQPFFYRTSGGSELDLLLVKGNIVQYALEIKLSTAPQLTRGNTEAVLDLQPLKLGIISPVSVSFSIKDKWKVYGVEEFLKELSEDI